MSEQPDYPAPSPAPPAPSPAGQEPAAEAPYLPADESQPLQRQADQPAPQPEQPAQATYAPPLHEPDGSALDRTAPGQAAQDEDVQVTQPEPPAEVSHPAFAEQHQPVPAGGEAVQPVGATSNVSPVLPPGAQTAAARAHRTLTHIRAVVEHEIAYIEKYVPAPVIHAAEAEVATFIRAML